MDNHNPVVTEMVLLQLSRSETKPKVKNAGNELRRGDDRSGKEIGEGVGIIRYITHMYVKMRI